MNLLLGIGNPRHGDDALGPVFSRAFRHPDWLPINAGAAPENFTSLIRRLRPELLVLLDAADMGLPPGALRRLSPDGLRERDFGTHAPSLAQLVAFLSQDIPRILILGIQPLCLLPGRLSPPVRSALHALGRQLPSFPSALLPSAGASDMLPPLHE